MLICVLEGLNQPQSLIHGAAHRQVIDSDLAKYTLAIDDKEAPEDIRVHSEELVTPTGWARGESTISLGATGPKAGRALPKSDPLTLRMGVP